MSAAELSPWERLLALMHGHSDVVDDLRRVAIKTEAPKSLPPFDVPSGDYLRRRRAAKRLGAALESLRRSLAGAPEDLLQAVAGAAPHLASGSLADWQRDLDLLSETTSDLLGIQRGQRGAPINYRKRSIERGAARVLQLRGIRLTKARDGLLSKVLMLMYEATNEHVPEDMMPVLQRLIPKRRGRLIRTAKEAV